MLHLLTLAASLAAPADAASATVLTPEEAVRAALTGDPALAARVADVTAAQGLKDEIRGLRYNPDVEMSFAVDGSKQTASLTQPFSVTGEGVYGGRSARANLEAARAGAERARYETAASTRRAYARAVVSRELLRYAVEDRALLARLRGVAESRVAAGEGIDLDLRLARLEEARALAAWLDAQEQVSVADAELAALVGVRPGELVRDPLAAGRADSRQPAPRSDVLAAQKATEAARQALKRERAARFPALSFGVFYENDEGRTIAGPLAGITIPLWSHNQFAVGTALGNLHLAEVQEASITARATAEEALAAQRLRVAEEALAVLPPDIGADAALARRAIEELFTSGELNLPDTLLLRSRVVEGERAWLEARASVALARIDASLAKQSDSLLP